MPSKLEAKKMRVGNESRLLNQRLEKDFDSTFPEPTGSLISTEKACDSYLNIITTINEILDKTQPIKTGNIKRDNNLI